MSTTRVKFGGRVAGPCAICLAGLAGAQTSFDHNQHILQQDVAVTNDPTRTGYDNVSSALPPDNRGRDGHILFHWILGNMAAQASCIVLSPQRAQLSRPSDAIDGSYAKRIKLQHVTKYYSDKHVQRASYSFRQESPLLSLDGLPLVRVLNFLVGAPDDVEAYSSAHPPFRSVNRANELWERLCRSRWKGKFGYRKRYGSAKASSANCPSPDYWHQLYYQTEADAKRNNITLEELTSLTFSCRSWFNPIIKPANWKKRHRVQMSGLQHSNSDQVKFVLSSQKQCTGKVTGHPSGVIDWFWQSGGSIVNIETPRPSKFRTLRARRLPNWGWELASDVIVLRAVDRAELIAIDKLWYDYTSMLVDQPTPREVKERLGNQYPYKWREIPNIPALMDRIPWEQWDDDPRHAATIRRIRQRRAAERNRF